MHFKGLLHMVGLRLGKNLGPWLLIITMWQFTLTASYFQILLPSKWGLHYLPSRLLCQASNLSLSHSLSLLSCILPTIPRLPILRYSFYKISSQYEIPNGLPLLIILGTNSSLILALKTLKNKQIYISTSSKVTPLDSLHFCHNSMLGVHNNCAS